MNTQLPTIYTVFEREILLTFLDQLEQNAFNSEIDVKSWASQHVPQEMSDKVMAFLFSDGEEIDSEKVFRKSKALRKEILELETIDISVPSELSVHIISKISNFINESKAKRVLLNIQYEKDLIAGAVVASRGYILENSIRSYFENRKGASHGF